ncbi:MAG: DUF5686 and carboxypeptidase regulatory-like domain-containing protein, partial [Bacteroidia bacterium]|nr:DUF5686 and carboxypeptidase regulatory-like domain-containing protein [Bacteroidia bacterium]MDW8058289.1 DUF5686 family protein [Bacteroidia bacterium]
MEKGVGLLLGGILSAQVWVSATVVDSAGEPLPFVSVYNLRAHQGTYTDLQGRFRIEALPTDTIEIRCVGYQTLRVPASSFSAVVRLVEQPIEVMPVVIRPGENPAHELIRRLQAQRGRWDPLGRPHKYLSYNKLTLGLPDSVRSDTLPPHLFLWETETEKVYHSPSRQIETLRAQRVVGNLPVQSILSPTSFLPISLYTDRLRLLENHLISPIGDEALNYYEYAIRDTIFSGKDTLIRIDFFPQRGREAWTLKGQLTIVLPDAALYAFQGEAYIPSFQSSLLQTSFYRIWHYYERLGDTLWFPTQLHSEVKLKVRTAQAGVGLILRSRSFLRSVELLRESERPLYPEVVLPEQVPSVEQRAEPLTPEESRSYQVLDSLLRKVELRRWQWLLDLPTLVSGRISLGRVNLIWRPFLLYHEAEGLRPQMGLETNDNLSERFRVRVWVGYGSYRWAGAQGTPWRYGVEGEMGQRWRGRLFYYDDVRELTLPRLLDEQPAFLPGEQRLYEVPVRGYAFRWESMVRERAGGMYLRLPLGGRALGYFSGIVAERSLFGERQQGIVTTFGMEYLHNQVLLRRGGL